MVMLLIVLTWGLGLAISPQTKPLAMITWVASTICTMSLAISFGGHRVVESLAVRGNGAGIASVEIWRVVQEVSS